MLYTYKQLQDRVLRRLDELNNPTSRDLVKELLNDANAQRAGQMRWPWMLSTVKTLTTVPGQTEYALDANIGQLLYIYNPNTGKPLEEVPKRTVGNLTGFSADPGPARRFMRWGLWPVQRQPSTPSVLTIQATSVADDGKFVLVTGRDANGVEQQESIQVNGLAAESGFVTFAEITGLVRIGGTWQGSLTVTANSGSDTLVTLLRGEVAREYPTIVLLEPPTSSEGLQYRYYRTARTLSNDEDLPDVPGAQALILMYDALIEFAAYNDDVEASEVSVWVDRRDDLERQLLVGMLESNTLGASPERVHDNDSVPDDDWLY